MKAKILLLLFLGMLNVQAQNTQKPSTNKKETSKKPAATEGIFATIATNKGEIVLALEFQKAPVTVANFMSLADGTNTFVTDEKLKKKPFYNGNKFHRVIKDFMIQGGDPNGNGSGGAGYSFKDEFNPELRFDKGGILAMANSGPETNSSQFFITHKDTPWLNDKHTIFGHVISGMDVVNAIVQDDVIIKITISKKGQLAKKFDAPKVFATYFNNKDEDRKKQQLIDAENQKKKEALEAENKRIYNEKYAGVISAKAAYIAATKATATVTPSGLGYQITQKGGGIKPAAGSTVLIHYAGYFEDGTLFDSSMLEVNKTYGKEDPRRVAQYGYKPFPFEIGKKEGLIPGFLEGVELMTIGDKAILFVPSSLAYGPGGAGDVIPPNTNLVFELEMTDK